VDWRLDTEPNTPRSNSQELLLGAQAPPRQKRPSYVGSDASKEKRQRSFETVPELHLDDWLAETVQAEDLEKIRWLLAAANIQIKLAYRWYACMAVIYETCVLVCVCVCMLGPYYQVEMCRYIAQSIHQSSLQELTILPNQLNRFVDHRSSGVCSQHAVGCMLICRTGFSTTVVCRQLLSVRLEP
jgi:hypothetical protein